MMHTPHAEPHPTQHRHTLCCRPHQKSLYLVEQHFAHVGTRATAHQLSLRRTRTRAVNQPPAVHAQKKQLQQLQAPAVATSPMQRTHWHDTQGHKSVRPLQPTLKAVKAGARAPQPEAPASTDSTALYCLSLSSPCLTHTHNRLLILPRCSQTTNRQPQQPLLPPACKYTLRSSHASASKPLLLSAHHLASENPRSVRTLTLQVAGRRRSRPNTQCTLHAGCLSSCLGSGH